MKENNKKTLTIQEADGATYQITGQPISIGTNPDNDINMVRNIKPKEGTNYLYWGGYIRNPNTTSLEEVDFILEIEDLQLEDGYYTFKDKKSGREYKTSIGRNFVEDNYDNRCILDEIDYTKKDMEYQQKLLNRLFDALETLNPSKTFINL